MTTDTTTTPGMLSRLAAARASVSERNERAERLPRALCRYCGGLAGAGEGGLYDVVPPNVKAGPSGQVTPGAREAEQARWEARQPREASLWTRSCETCETAVRESRLAASAFAVLVGRHVAEVDAQAALATLRHWEVDPTTGHPSGLGGIDVFSIESERAVGEPYGHLSADDKTAMLAALREVEGRHIPEPGPHGACGMCGVAQHTDWEATGSMVSSALRWPDGEPALMCGDCFTVWRRRGGPQDDFGLRAVVWEALTGEPVGLGGGVDEAVVPYCRSRHADRDGVEAAWAWARAGLERMREEQAAAAAAWSAEQAAASVVREDAGW